MTPDQRDEYDRSLRIETAIATLTAECKSEFKVLGDNIRELKDINTSFMTREEHKSICTATNNELARVQKIVYGACAVCGSAILIEILSIVMK
jgi:RNA polymerase-binding transcription factor DksA